jgi:hypothetical protein
MPAHDVDELRIALGRPDRREMADGPDGEADEPEAQAEADGAASVPLRMAMERGAPPSRMARSAPMDRDEKPGTASSLRGGPPSDQRPAAEREEGQEEARAGGEGDRQAEHDLDQRRKPPDVSPKASVRPVTMMMMTAMILATGPSIDWRID